MMVSSMRACRRAPTYPPASPPTPEAIPVGQFRATLPVLVNRQDRERHQVFFSIITRQAIRRGSFSSVTDLIAAIETFIDGWNDRCHSFTWTKTADKILPHCRPGKRTSFTRH